MGARVRSLKPTEAAFQRQVIDYSGLCGWRRIHFRPAIGHHGRYQTPLLGDKGFPDTTLVRGDRLIFAELKVRPNKPSVDQEAWLAALAKAGAATYVWYPEDWSEIMEVLR